MLGTASGLVFAQRKWTLVSTRKAARGDSAREDAHVCPVPGQRVKTVKRENVYYVHFTTIFF